MSIDVASCFSGKTIFFTGVTGFVGKVFLYKLLKDLPDIRKIIVLVRPKKDQTPQQRFEKEVLSSPCYLPLKSAIGEAEWKKRISRIQPVVGDILDDGVGLSVADTNTITQEVHYIVHLAATVDFQEKLNISVQMNVLGTMRVVALARKCVHLEAIVHTSTCYVNWNRHGKDAPVQEQLYPLPFDPEEMCKHILSVSDRFMPDETIKLLTLYKYPNTYTFTKSLAEHILLRHKGKLPLVIVRPSIVGCSWKQPTPGWVDALTAAGGLFLTAGLGIVRELQCNQDNIADIVPVDFVCNTLIKALCKTMLYYRTQKGIDSQVEALKRQSKGLLAAAAVPIKASPTHTAVVPMTTTSTTFFNAATTAGGGDVDILRPESNSSDGGNQLPFVFQSCTSSSLNNLTWKRCREALVAYWNSKPHPKALGTCDPQLIDSQLVYWLSWYGRREIPLKAMKFAASLPPPLGAPDKLKLLARYEKALARAADFNYQFKPFTLKEWRFDAANTVYLDDGLNAKSKAVFATDPFDLNWATYVDLYSWGVMTHIMKNNDGRAVPTIPKSGAELFQRARM
jgi:fatty acyl-CoA reductase